MPAIAQNNDSNEGPLAAQEKKPEAAGAKKSSKRMVLYAVVESDGTLMRGKGVVKVKTGRKLSGDLRSRRHGLRLQRDDRLPYQR